MLKHGHIDRPAEDLDYSASDLAANLCALSVGEWIAHLDVKPGLDEAYKSHTDDLKLAIGATNAIHAKLQGGALLFLTYRDRVLINNKAVSGKRLDIIEMNVTIIGVINQPTLDRT